MRPAAREDLSVLCLCRLAPSVTRVVICVSRAYVLLDGPRKRETARSLFKSLQNEQCLVLHLQFS